MKWEKLTQYAPLIRFGGNFGVAFFGAFVAFDFVSELPTPDLIIGALLSSSVTVFFALSYEARKFQLEKKNHE